MKKLISILSLTLWVGILFAQKKPAEMPAVVIDEFVRKALEAAPMVPSVSIAVVKRDQPIFVKSYGHADPENQLLATNETSYYIASITKSFVGLLALLLEEEGVVNLDLPLTNYKPFKELKNRELFEDVTIRQLLNHTSGLSNGYLTFRDAYTGDKSPEVMKKLLEETTAKRDEGKVFRYDNLGYNIFDILLREELGKDWRDLLQEKIFDPLDMDKTTAYMSKAQRENWSIAWPYTGLVGEQPERSYLLKNDQMMQAAGGLITTADDATRWISLFLTEGKQNGKRVCSKKLILDALASTAEDNREGQIFHDQGYGVGWHKASFKDEEVYYHFGGFIGFFSHISIMPDQDLGIAAFSNESAFGDNVSNLIASFAYDYLLGNIDAVEDYDPQLEALKKKIAEIQSNVEKDRLNRVDRQWKLDLPKTAYTGTFESPYLGTIQVDEVDNELHVKMGTLWAIATPYIESNTLRVDFGTGGAVIQYKIEKGAITEIDLDGEPFQKI